MKVFKLDNNHQPYTTVPYFDTMIWSERYQAPGDFKIVVEDDISILSVLTLEDLISHTDTNEVMIVENHEVKRDKDKKLIVTVSGRSFETFAENRATLGYGIPIYDDDGTETVDSLPTDTASDIALILLREALEDGTATSDDLVNNLVVSSDMRVLSAVLEHVIRGGDVYSKVIDILRVGDAGIKMVRPHADQTTMDMIVHDGADLTDTVIFYSQYEDLEDTEYFWSVKDYKNYAKITSDFNSRLYRDRNEASPLTGLQRRVMYVDATDLDAVYYPATASDPMSGIAQTALDARRRMSLVQARITNTARPKFKINYDVGDLVTVFTEFAIAQVMRVTEHILTVDKDGIRGFPSLSAVGV